MAVLTQYIHYWNPETFHLYCCFLGKGQAEMLLIVTLYTEKKSVYTTALYPVCLVRCKSVLWECKPDPDSF